MAYGAGKSPTREQRIQRLTAKAIYGKVGSNALSSQLESVTIQPSEASAFTHPTGQLLRDGTIQAIPKDKVRWSDDPEQLVRVRRRATPIQDRKAFGGPNKTVSPIS